jgi:hypothetical protein
MMKVLWLMSQWVLMCHPIVTQNRFRVRIPKYRGVKIKSTKASATSMVVAVAARRLLRGKFFVYLSCSFSLHRNFAASFTASTVFRGCKRVRIL